MKTSGGTFRSQVTARPSAVPQPADDGARPELADVGRLARRYVRRAVTAARAEEASTYRLLADHLGPGTASLPVASESWHRYDHVNVQAGLDAWLAEEGREHVPHGLTGFHHIDFSFSDLAQPGHIARHLRLGNLTTAERPAGPGGVTVACVQCAIYLVTEDSGPVALLVRGPDEHGPMQGVSVEALSPDPDRGRRVVEEIRRLAIEHNVFRGHVLEFGGEVFDGAGGMLLRFLDRPRVPRDQVILPPALLDGVERQVIGVARHAERLLASGQHLKRGVLLHGAPGTGKTHTIRYLLGQLSGVTVLILSGDALNLIAEACSVARTLQPAAIVVEDVDLIAEEREMGAVASHSLLFQLLNEMDGLGADLDVTFLLTTNRPDLLEPALTQRPGRVDHATMLPLPDAAARRRLLELYRGRLELDLAEPDLVIGRTEGVTASFIKELLRRAALRAAEEEEEEEEEEDAGGGALRVTDHHLGTALDELLDTRHQLTRALLGSHIDDETAQEPG
jgi:hypothetical protein